MKKILFMSLLLMFTLLQQVTAQNRNISGRVTDRQSGEGLPGVTVLLKGTTNGVSTNSDGTYTLSVPSAGGTLVFSSIGYIQTERAIGTEDQLNIGLAGDSKQLSEVVVTGYGTQERRDVTGSIASVQGESISNLATPSFAQQLSGRAAGVTVTTPSGLLGQQPRILIRGVNSISSGTTPLIVVDGVPIFTGSQSQLGSGFTNNPLADINPNDIESYEVLKDGSSSAIYGSRAANGVILITTKKGKLGRAQVNYDTYFGWAKTLKRYKVLGADDFITISNEKAKNANSASTGIAFPYLEGGSPVSTDWQDEIFRTGFQQNHVLSVSGATDKTNYYFSGGYTNQTGVVRSNELQRFSFRSNLDQQVKDWFRVGFNLGASRTETRGLNTSTNGISGNITNALSAFPNVPARNPDGTPYVDPTSGTLGQGNNTQPISFAYPNIIFQLDNNIFRNQSYRLLGNVYGEVEPVKGLRLRGQFGTDTNLNDDFQYLDPRQGDGRSSNGLVVQSQAPNVRWNSQATATYQSTLGTDHKINIVAGGEWQKSRQQYFYAQGQGLSDLYFGKNNIISNTITTPNIFGDFAERGYQSYFGRANYSFKDRYLLTATVRADKISSLPTNNRLGYFPGGSLGWRVSEEPFFKSAGISFISDLKLRGSYAVVGNTEIGDYPYAGLFGAGKYGTQAGIGYNTSGQFGNANLKWENSKKTDFGIDLGFLDNRFTVTADYYENNNDDLILFVRTPVSLGVPLNGYSANVGAMTSKGFELTVNTQNVRTEDFSWSTNFNFSTNNTKITRLANGNEDILNPYNVTRLGEPIGAIYGYQYEGVNPANGNPIYRKQDAAGTLVQGNLDTRSYVLYDPSNPGDVSKAATLSAATDRKVLGNSNPTFFGGLTNTLTYKGFDFEIFARYSGGNKIMNVTRQQLLRMDFVNNSTEILDRWTPTNTNTNTPRVTLNNSDFTNKNGEATSRFVEKGDFIRIQNITLGYTLPKSVMGITGLNRVRVYGQIQNAATFTKYKGVDPEVNSNITSTQGSTANNQSGIDNNSNPQQRIVMAGLNVSF
ncbi:SusC/RagA family TonB-linked outer membrane protein [Hymenobacter cellulosivorans]|uniref:TonB-dependent receptor n=1 Tax=Hymenobacter cellulosivorans TaxID=2932249 RepID=A0ABY4F8L1_9BACT|nr:TonB-dependent receptor [Hymenobacter cellulosivorans]UOQ52860.1 TonB-dependent receptor [Hymenobacter cellulosivorans]